MEKMIPKVCRLSLKEAESGDSISAIPSIQLSEYRIAQRGK